MLTKRLLGTLVLLVVLFSLPPTQVQSQDVTPNPQISAARVGDASIERMAPVPGGPGYVMIHVSSFLPQDNTVSYSLNGPAMMTQSGTATYKAPADLPNGATITKVVLYCYDNDPAGSISLYLFKYPLPGSVAISDINLSSLDSSVDQAIQLDLTAPGGPNPFVVDLQGNAYLLFLTMPAAASGKTIYTSGVRIDYSYSSSLPTMQK
jgi:hypothetical protein